MRRLGLVSDWVRMSRTASLSMGQRGQVRLGVWVLACCVGACLLCAGFTAQLERGDFPCALRAFLFAPALPPSRVRPVDQGPSLRVRQLREASCCKLLLFYSSSCRWIMDMDMDRDTEPGPGPGQGPG